MYIYIYIIMINLVIKKQMYCIQIYRIVIFKTILIFAINMYIETLV